MSCSARARALAWVLCSALIALPATGWGQAENSPPREFPAFRGTWALDEREGAGRIAGLAVARTIQIATSPTQITLVKDSSPAEVYRVDGMETTFSDGRRGSFVLVAEMLALTTRRTREQRGRAFTNIISDAYGVSGDVLTIERQLSVLVQPPGNLATLTEPGNNRQTLVYRRSQPAVPR